MIVHPSAGQQLPADGPIAVTHANFAAANGFVLCWRYLDDHGRVLNAVSGIGGEPDRLNSNCKRALDNLQEPDGIVGILIVQRLNEMNVLEVRLNPKVSFR